MTSCLRALSESLRTRAFGESRFSHGESEPTTLFDHACCVSSPYPSETCTAVEQDGPGGILRPPRGYGASNGMEGVLTDERVRSERVKGSSREVFCRNSRLALGCTRGSTAKCISLPLSCSMAM